VNTLNYTISPLRLEVLDKFYEGRQVYRTIDEFIYDNSSPGITLRIVVPIGFETDFASIPRLFWGLINPSGQHSKAAVIHDYMYKMHDSPLREICDAVLLEMMTRLHTPFIRKWAIYTAVRCFGWLYFNKNKEKD
jgi:hypothetical protein